MTVYFFIQFLNTVSETYQPVQCNFCYVCSFMGWGVCATAPMSMSGDNLWDSVVFFYHVGSRVQSKSSGLEQFLVSAESF